MPKNPFRYSIKDADPTKIFVGLICTTIGGIMVVSGYELLKNGGNDFLRGLGITLREVTKK